MSYPREKVARAVEHLATGFAGIEARVAAALARHIYDLDPHYQTGDEELRVRIDALVDRWMKIRTPVSTYESRVGAMSIATELCNLASEFRVQH